jgi:hypothetical protein
VESIFHQSGRRKEVGAEEKVPIYKVSVIIEYDIGRWWCGHVCPRGGFLPFSLGLPLIKRTFAILLSYNCYYQFSGAAVVAELTEVDALPCAEVQPAISNGDGDADTAQRGLGVSRHIVCSFQRMLILRTVLWNQTVEDCFHVHANIRVTVLVDAQSATGVLREDVHNARLGELWQLAYNLTRHQMETATFRIQSYFYLLYHIIKVPEILGAARVE